MVSDKIPGELAPQKFLEQIKKLPQNSHYGTSNWSNGVVLKLYII